MQVQHQPNGRVGPPRCYECNAPLGLDDAAFSSKPFQLPDFSRFLCNDCRDPRHAAHAQMTDGQELMITQQPSAKGQRLRAGG